jgi:hypothetical protein
MNLADFVKALKIAALKYMIKPRFLALTNNAIKARIDISDNIYVQFIITRSRVHQTMY